MVILGIDPGMAITGYGVIESGNNTLKVIDYGVITTPSTLKHLKVGDHIRGA